MKIPKSRPQFPPGKWKLSDARAHLGELVRRVRDEGPQRIIVQGREEVVMITAEEFRRLRGELTGSALIDALQASPFREINLDSEAVQMPVRGAPVNDDWLAGAKDI